MKVSRSSGRYWLQWLTQTTGRPSTRFVMLYIHFYSRSDCMVSFPKETSSMTPDLNFSLTGHALVSGEGSTDPRCRVA